MKDPFPTMELQKNEYGFEHMAGQSTGADPVCSPLMATDELLHIVAQHTYCQLYHYDPATGEIRPWGDESNSNHLLAALRAECFGDAVSSSTTLIPPGNIEAARQFFIRIQTGVPSGEAILPLHLDTAGLRWYHLKYSNLSGNDSSPRVLISLKDITEYHTYELAYLHREQAVAQNAGNYFMYAESSLTTSLVDRISGRFFSKEELQQKYSHQTLIQLLLEKKFRLDHASDSVQQLNRETLLHLYEQGDRQVSTEFSVLLPNGEACWILLDITMVPDPFDNSIKLFTLMKDVTNEKNEHLRLRQKANYDAMTGLLRRDVGEARIREYLSMHDAPGGVLITLDLDDLKGINDTLGHTCGDKAIIAIADTLKNHFRKDDILVRSGGDEFMVFLPKAGSNVTSIESSLELLLRKLSTVYLGDNNERAIHCSIGCAVEYPESDTFEALYQRADIALYHIKRSGKNNFTFFVPEMLESNFRFKVAQMPPVIQETDDTSLLKQLLNVMSVQYPGILSFNLTKNQFRFLSTGSNAGECPPPGPIESFLDHWKPDVHPEDRESTFRLLNRAHLLDCYANGKRRLVHYCRNKEIIGYIRTELDVRLYTAENGDVCAFLFLRWDDEEANAQKDPPLPAT